MYIWAFCRCWRWAWTFLLVVGTVFLLVTGGGASRLDGHGVFLVDITGLKSVPPLMLLARTVDSAAPCSEIQSLPPQHHEGLPDAVK
jgi:hypothetical protein